MERARLHPTSTPKTCEAIGVTWNFKGWESLDERSRTWAPEDESLLDVQ
jgi:hypothetical protein